MTFATHRLTSVIALVSSCLVLMLAAGDRAGAAEPETVTITGNVYAFIFGGNVDRLPGAVVKIDEFPELEAIAGPNGAYSIEVPNNANVTPYATFPGYYTVHDQTFHTRGRDLNQVNFQMPTQAIAELMAGLVDGEVEGPPGSQTVKKCAIVSTFFQVEGRNFLDFDDFHNFRPHGVKDATATAKTATGEQPVDAIYFNSSVIPDRTQLASSRDGGVIWANVPDGVYTVTAQHPTTRFSQFQATCKPGRLVNANPPWGLYQLGRNEEPNPAVLPYVAPGPPAPDTVLDANLASAKVVRKGPKKRVLTVRVRSGEKVSAAINANQGKRKLQSKKNLATGSTTISVPVKPAFKAGGLNLKVKLTDAAGNTRTDQANLNVPAVKKKRK